MTRPMLLVALLLVGVLCHAEDTVVEKETAPDKVTNPHGGLGTQAYAVSKAEAPFLAKVPADEKTNATILDGDEETYSIKNKKGKSVAWFGIVRKITKLKDKDEYELLVEHKYFDGLTDLHILALSFNGGGDFKCIVRGKDLELPQLCLMRCYGVVSDEKDGVPTVGADYVRVYPWKTFTFLDAYGKDKSNAEWRNLCKVKLDDIYDPYPDDAYYKARLGTPEAAKK